MLAGEGNKALGKSYETDSERALIDYRLYGVVGPKCIGTVPQFRHNERELLRECRLLEGQAVVELTGCHLEHRIEF